MDSFIGVGMLSCGEKILGEIISINENEIIMKNMLSIKEIQLPDGHFTYMTFGVLPTNENVKEIKIKRSHFIIEPILADDHLITSHKNKFSSILTPQKSKLII